ncbi:RNA polymerase sigma factor SigZ [Shewanella pneumatophori]|uniref:RNA polymerase sigma factor SigZ n=1 Tax=Shewanella pneumatophori TaxID=314092 RepID=A0A9X1ZGL7_9GAMM|nr:RNA polymerase sigma factor SigZ [Shewanella pneumatophori]MCL1139075.1 RNA polymerase sigma factor SigZ [Shewanella pneumatophori]
MKTESIWQEYRNKIKVFLHAKVSDPDDVDDLLQEILIKTFDNLHSVQSEAKVKSWLYQVANNAIIDFYRKRGRAAQLEGEELWYELSEESTEQALSRCIEPFINALPEDSSALLTAIDLHGQSQKDYAAEHGISYSTLKSRVQKSRERLRGLYEECCYLSLDKQGNVVEFDPKSSNCKGC